MVETEEWYMKINNLHLYGAPLLKVIGFIVVLFLSSVHAKTLSLEEVPGSTKVDAAKVAELMQQTTLKNGNKVRSILFIDTRKKKDLEQGGSIPGAVHFDLKKSHEFNLSNILEHPHFVKDVLLFCNGHSCLRAQHATEKVLSWKQNGEDEGKLGNVYYFRDGFPSYRDYRFEDGSKNPVVRPY